MQAIEIKNVSKIYENGVKALDDISLSIEEGEIFGIIGMSGAGKSTLVRTFNHLEQPTSGTITVLGKELGKQKRKDLRNLQRKIAMIFQHFNLLMQKTVIDNVCLPLLLAGESKANARKRAKELLEIVGLADKAKAYPAQLSGGQKQRVAIARALSSNPSILLCDEATSALDPQTTQSILALLKDINQKYKITIVIITHEMSVIQQVCHKVAILKKGRLVEEGNVSDVFSAPKSEEGRNLIIHGGQLMKEMQSDYCIRIVYHENSSFEPVIANMVLKYHIPVNILFADTKNVEGKAVGEMVLQLPPEEEKNEQMINYLKGCGLTVEEVKKNV